MIASFKHKGVQAFYHSGRVEGIQRGHQSRLRLLLIALHSAREIEDMQIMGFDLQPVLGVLKGVWSLSVAAHWRMTFRFDRGYVYGIHYEEHEL